MQKDDDPSDGMNQYMDQHLTMWGCAISAQVRRHGILDQEALARDQITVSGLTETVLALHIKADTQRSPEHGQPYLLGSRDMENLRDLLNFATDRGMLQRQLCVSE